MNGFGNCVAAILLIVTFAIALSGQKAPKPILVDEFGVVGCEDFGSRIDNWIQEAKNSPELAAIALVSGRADELLGRITYREWIKGQLLWRFQKQVDREHFRILEGGLADTLKVELWLTSKDDQSVLQREQKWDLSLPLRGRRSYYQSQDDGGICPFIDRAAVFKQLIEANPTLNGLVIFHSRNMRKFLKQKAEFLAKEPKLAANRFSFPRPRSSESFYDGHFEYWLVLTKQNH